MKKVIIISTKTSLLEIKKKKFVWKNNKPIFKYIFNNLTKIK